MGRERKSLRTVLFIILLVVWGIVAPVAAYFYGWQKGCGHGLWLAGEGWKESAGRAVVSLKENAVGAAGLVKDSVTTVTVTLTSGTTRLASTLGEKTDRVLSGLGGSLTSATAVVTSYSLELGSDLKEEAREAGTRIKAEALRAKEAAGQRTSRLVSGVRERIAGLLDGDDTTTPAVTGSGEE